jgi:glutamate---cysteine ligase / carboxylate-amine ligase
MDPISDLQDVSGDRLRSIFDAVTPLTVGLEEEVMLLDPDGLDLTPVAAETLDRMRGDHRFKAELPASQLEILTEPLASATEAIAALEQGRRDLAESLRGLARPAVAGVHPFSAAEGELSEGERYAHIREEFGPIARRQLVASLQVHVAVGGADRTLAVYNALRGYLPEIAALAANARYYEGRDSGMASVRPKIAELLPRQGLPPAIGSWEEFAGELRWGAASGFLAEPRLWWWELRPHPGFGTLEVRVPDAQTTLTEAAGVAATVQTLVALLAERHDGGEPLAPAPTWRIAENRWSAARHGVEGEMADLQSGARRPTRERLGELLDELEPAATRHGSSDLLRHARDLVEQNGAIRQREIAADGGTEGLASWMADRFLDPVRGIPEGPDG